MKSTTKESLEIPAGKRSRRFLLLGLLILLGVGALGWMERNTILEWYYLRGLASAKAGDQALWAERVASLGEQTLPGLVDLLKREDDTTCSNAGAALTLLLRRGDSADSWKRLATECPGLSAAGQRALLSLPCTEGLQMGAAPLLSAVASCEDARVLNAALDLCEKSLSPSASTETRTAVRGVVRGGLLSGDSKVRLRSVRLALQPGLELLDQVAGLLNDPVAEVRRAAVLAVGPADKVILDEALLPGLRDSDKEVQRLTEAALRGRGLNDDHLRLSRLLVDPAPGKRLEVLDHLSAASDLEPGIWLRRLSHDPAPSVRAAAARVMAQQSVVDLRDRLDQMARSDPSPSVSYLAGFYLQNAQKAPDH